MSDEKKKNAGKKVHDLTAEDCKRVLANTQDKQSVYYRHVMARAKAIGVDV